MGQFRTLSYMGDDERLAVAICHSGNHVGVLYRDEDDPSDIKLFHLCWHRILRNSHPKMSDKCGWWIVPSIEPEQVNSVIAHIGDIWDKNGHGTMPYGFSDPRGFFDNDGNIVFGPGQVGLTCATLVLAVFDLSGVPLVDY